jgi:uncharacterized protein YidB (DUF937 family)
MGLLDQVVGEIEGISSNQGSGMQAAVGALLGPDHANGLAGLVQRFESAGLGNLMQSWISNGSNKPISPQEVHQAVGDDKVQQASAQSGIPVPQLLALLAQHLPAIIDRMTPNGAIPQQTAKSGTT